MNVYQAGSSPPPSGLPPNTWINQVTVVMTAPISTTNITGLRICTRGSSLRSCRSARADDVARNSEIARRSTAMRLRARWRSIGGLLCGRGRG